MRQKRGLAVACIGGGTGLSMLLRGIKQYSEGRRNGYELIDMDHLTAIVTVSDDGGSSGKLIDEFGVLPPGDIRKCMVALSDEGEIMSKLFEFRFGGEGELGGHSVGNLLLSALTQINGGSFPKAIQDACRVLAVRGQILPATLDSTTLCAELASGEIVRGESHIPKRASREAIKRIFLEPRNNDKPASTPSANHDFKDFKCKALVDAVLAIQQADAIIIGPGSLYTSIIPNLVVEDIAKAIQNSDALKIYVCNVVTQPGETDGYSVSDHVRAILDHAYIKFDYLMVNNRIASEELVKQYMKLQLHEQYTRIKRYAEEAIGALEGRNNSNSSLEEIKSVSERMAELSEEIKRIENAAKIQVLYEPQVDKIDEAQIVEEDLICDIQIIDMGVQKRVLRHDPEKLTMALMRLLMLHNKSKDQPSAVSYQLSAKKPKS